MNTTESLIQCPAVSSAAQSVNEIVKPVRFPSQPQEWKIISIRECPTPEEMQLCTAPDQAAAYWRAHVPLHPYFNPEVECLVVLNPNAILQPLAASPGGRCIAFDRKERLVPFQSLPIAVAGT